MSVNVKIPTQLRTYTQGKEEIPTSATTVREAIDAVEKLHPGMRDRLCDDKGVRRFINIFANDEDIRFLQNLDTKLKDGDTVRIVPAIAGGASLTP